MRALLLLASLSPDAQPVPDFGTDPKPYILMFIVGFAIAVFGHIVRARPLVILGIGLVFLGTAILPMLTYITRS